MKKALPKNEMDRMNNRGGGREMGSRGFQRNDRSNSGSSWGNNNRNNSNEGWMNNGPYNNSGGFNGNNTNWGSNSQPTPWNNSQGGNQGNWIFSIFFHDFE